MSDQSLVEMFSRCKLDPSFVSTGSLEDSGLAQSRMYQSGQGDSTGTSGYRTAESLTSPGYPLDNDTRSFVKGGPRKVIGSGQSLNSNCDYVNMSSDHNVSDLRPAKISPLDPSKLWAEFNERLNFGSDTAINRSLGNRSIRVVPDHLRDITSLSLSHSCLTDTPDRFHSLPDSTRLSETASSFFYKKGDSRTHDSTGSSLNNSQGVSFSNLSLQLPDSSYNSRHRHRLQNQSETNGGSYGDIQQSDKRDRRRTGGPMDSLQSVDRQSSSYSSDQGLSSTDRGLSSSSSAVDRTHRSFASSGFQSEESNFSEQSPICQFGLHHNQYHQSTPIVENEISTICSLPSTIKTQRVSLDADVCPPSHSTLDTTPLAGCDREKLGSVPVPHTSLFPYPQADTSDPTDMTRDTSTSSFEESVHVQSTRFVENEISTLTSLPSTVRTKRVSLDEDLCPPGYSSLSESNNLGDKVPHIMSETITAKDDISPPKSLFTSDDIGNLPPLTVRSRSSSSDGSSRMGRFFKNPLTEDRDSPADLSDEDSAKGSSSDGSSSRGEGSFQNERSSISAMISNMSSSCLGTSTLDSMSVDSNSTTPHNRSMQGSLASKEMMEKEAPVYVNVEECSPYNTSSTSRANTSTGSLSKRRSRLSDPDRLKYLSSDPTEQTKLMELLAEMSNATGEQLGSNATGEQLGSSSSSETGDYVNVEKLSPQAVEDFVDSPYHLGRNVDKFNRERWRASLDKEMRDQLVKEIENMAPRKLYKLKSKAPQPKKKQSPLKISDYANSPYKFRQPEQRLDYENLKNCSPASLGSAFEDMKAVTPALYTDYVNVYDVSGERTGACPLATPESLSDAAILDNNIETSGRLSKTFNVPLETVRGEMDLECYSDRSSELSRTKSPINTSGINSAFKPVKSKNSSYSRDSSSSVSPGAESSGNLSGVSANRSNSSSDRSSMSECGEFKKPRPPYNSQVSNYTEDSSSFGWSRRSSGLDSVSEANDATYQKMNYLEVVGKDPLSFTMSQFPADGTASLLSKHSHTDSIPWEDSINKSTDFQAPDEQGSCKSSARKPLKALENTPVISPIYGGQSVKSLDDLSCRKRYMSTPKLTSNSVMSLSDTSTESRSASKLATPNRRDLRNRTFNNTSTWSSQSEQSYSQQNNGLYESCFSSLSKTTYI